MIVIYKYSLVAQSVEQVTVNHWVGGSNPSQGANQNKGFRENPILKIFFQVAHR